jgi:hypothetical protein
LARNLLDLPKRRFLDCPSTHAKLGFLLIVHGSSHDAFDDSAGTIAALGQRATRRTITNCVWRSYVSASTW